MNDTAVLVIARDKFARPCKHVRFELCPLIALGTHVHMPTLVDSEVYYEHYRIKVIYNID